MHRSSPNYTGMCSQSQEDVENLAIEFFHCVKNAQTGISRRHSTENQVELELEHVCKDHSSPSLTKEAVAQAFQAENSQDTLISIVDKVDVLVWTFARLWDVFSNVIANGTNDDSSNPTSSFSTLYKDPAHTDQGLNPEAGLIYGAGGLALLVGIAHRIYQLRRKRELNTYNFLQRRLNEMSNGYQDLLDLGHEEAYQYSQDDIINGMNEILKRHSFGTEANQSNDDSISPYDDYFELNQFIKTFNKFTETTPVQVIQNIWSFLDFTSLWFWIIWFPAYLAAGVALATVMPIVLIVTGIIGGLHLLHELGSFIYKKITKTDYSLSKKMQAQEELRISKLKQQYFMEQEHKLIMDTLKKKYDADVGTYDFCLAVPDDTRFIDDLDDNQSLENYLQSLDKYLDSDDKYIQSLDELADENVETGKLYLQKVELINKDGYLESCIKYVVKNPEGEIVRHVIPNNEINPRESFTRHDLNLMKDKILDYTHRQGHTLDLKRVDLAKELDELNGLNRVVKSCYEINADSKKMIATQEKADADQPAELTFGHRYIHPEVVFSSKLAKQLLGSEDERNERLIVSTIHSATIGFIFTSFILWLAASVALVIPAAAVAASVLSDSSITSYLSLGVTALIGLNTYCKIRAEQAAHEKKVYQQLTEIVSPGVPRGVTRLDRFTHLDNQVEMKKAEVVKLRDEITQSRNELKKFKKDDDKNVKELKKEEDKSLLADYDLTKVDVYNHYYFEKQRHKPSITTKVKSAFNSAYQFVGGGQSGILVARMLLLTGGIAAAVLTGTIVPFLICAGVAAAVMGCLQLAKYQLNRNQEHREFFLDTIDDRSDWLELKDKELNVIINELKKNKKTAEKNVQAARKQFEVEPDLSNKHVIINQPKPTLDQNKQILPSTSLIPTHSKRQHEEEIKDKIKEMSENPKKDKPQANKNTLFYYSPEYGTVEETLHSTNEKPWKPAISVSG